ncbi:FHA domain-containing protein [Actinomyces timonensis]|uniref:FHA domain-containing protein n=1 Tax=Actinomyces timonensis TaxID=1288391 RepID=A0AAU8N0G4_9ACTO
MTTEPQEPAAVPERGVRHMGPQGAARHVLPDLPVSQGSTGSGGPALPSSSPLSASAPSDAARASRPVHRRPVQTLKTVRPIRVVDMSAPSADAAVALPALHDLGSAAPAPSATSSPTGIIQEVPPPTPVIEDVPWTGSGSSGASAGSGASAPSAASASPPRRGRSPLSAVSAAVASVLSARSAGSAVTTGSAASAASSPSASSAVSAASAPAAPTRRARRKGRHAAEAEAVTRPVPLASLGIPEDAFSSVRSPGTPAPASPRSLTGSPLSPEPPATPSSPETPIITSTPLDSPESGRRAAEPIEDWSEGSDATVHALTGSMARSLSAQAAPPHLRLVPLTGGQSIALSDIALVGRAPENISRYNAAEAIRLADSSRTVSKTHACIVPTADGAWISDLHSTNGTRVIMDGVLTRLLPDVPVPVLPGTTIYFGSIGFILES